MGVGESGCEWLGVCASGWKKVRVAGSAIR